MLCTQFRVRSLAGFGCAALPAAVGAAGAVLAYLERTNPALLALLTGLRVESPGRWVGLDAATRRNLELTRSFGTGGTRGSLLGVLDLTRTPMGARALRRLVGQPLRDLEEIARRQGIVGALVGAPSARAALGDALATIGDLERLLGRIAGRGAGAREFLTLAAALRAIPEIETILGTLGPAASSHSPSGRACPSCRLPSPSIPARISSPCSRPRSRRTRTAPARSAPDSPPISTTRWPRCGERGSGWPRWRDASGSGRASAR